MPLEVDLCTVQEVKDELGQTTAQDDVVLGRLVTATSRWIERATGRYFGQLAATTFTFDGTGRRTIDLWPDLRVVTALGVAAYEGAGVYTAIPALEYFLEPQMRAAMGWPYEGLALGAIGTQSVFTRGRRTVQVTGDWGWAAVPADIAESARLIVAALQKRRKAGFNDTLGVDETGRVIIGKLVPQFARETVLRYRRREGLASSSPS